jgi:putative holliday junction resolvase
VRILAVDPGEKNIGLAVSDASGTIASPLTVISHVKRSVDAAVIASLAVEQAVDLIVIGQALDEEGNAGYRARPAQRLAEAVRTQTTLPVELWDESHSTQTARQIRIEMGVPRRQRRGHLDALAAVIILQDYLDEHEHENKA